FDTYDPPLRTPTPQHADIICRLCRTDPSAKKQMGISFIVFSMKSKGVTVRPIQTIDGGREVNEVFFADVEVPYENLIGEENKGWDYAKFLLGNERKIGRDTSELQSHLNLV